MEHDEIYKAIEEYKKNKIKQGDDHPDTLTSLNNLAVLFFNNDDYDRALPLYEECLAKYKRVLGDDHPDTRITRTNLDNLLLKMGSRIVVADADENFEDFNPAAGGGRNKKRHFRKSKKSKLTKRSRNVRRSRTRRGGRRSRRGATNKKYKKSRKH